MDTKTIFKQIVLTILLLAPVIGFATMLGMGFLAYKDSGKMYAKLINRAFEIGCNLGTAKVSWDTNRNPESYQEFCHSASRRFSESVERIGH